METHEVEILLVEDNDEDAELAVRALRKHRLANKVLVLKDGAAALDFLFSEGEHAGRDPLPRPRVILLDLKLPKVDGLEVLRRLKSDERTRHLPVVMMTSSRQESDLVASYRLGVNSYIVKPVEFEDFLRAVADVGLYWMLLNRPPA
jgi:two-component system, response regulator